jgi:hypothetical protein
LIFQPCGEVLGWAILRDHRKKKHPRAHAHVELPMMGFVALNPSCKRRQARSRLSVHHPCAADHIVQARL